jgi:hypothetical protein
VTAQAANRILLATAAIWLSGALLGGYVAVAVWR